MKNDTTTSNVLRRLFRTFPKVFTRESLNSLIRNHNLSMEALNDAAAVLAESEANPTVEISPLAEANVKSQSVSDFKLASALEIAKDDDRLIYDEFLQVDAQRNALVAKIAARYQDDVNAILNVAKTADGTDAREIDNLIHSDIVMNAIGISPTISNTKK